MSLIGIVAKKKDIQLIKKEIDTSKIEIIEITKESIENLKNIKFDEIIFIEDIKSEIKDYNLFLVAYEQEKNLSLKEVLKTFKSDSNKIKIAILIGPEGGLEESEVEQMKEAGAKIITLGKRILRTETVALSMTSILMYELENLKGE